MELTRLRGGGPFSSAIINILQFQETTVKLPRYIYLCSYMPHYQLKPQLTVDSHWSDNSAIHRAKGFTVSRLRLVLFPRYGKMPISREWGTVSEERTSRRQYGSLGSVNWAVNSSEATCTNVDLHVQMTIQTIVVTTDNRYAYINMID